MNDEFTMDAMDDEPVTEVVTDEPVEQPTERLNTPVNPGYNREQWLTDLAGKLEPLFDGSFPPYRVACSWPSNRCVASRR